MSDIGLALQICGFLLALSFFRILLQMMVYYFYGYRQIKTAYKKLGVKKSNSELQEEATTVVLKIFKKFCQTNDVTSLQYTPFSLKLSILGGIFIIFGLVLQFSFVTVYTEEETKCGIICITLKFLKLDWHKSNNYQSLMSEPKIQYMTNIRGEMVSVFPSSVDILIERGYLIPK